MRHVIPISGKDSLATALVQTAREPSLDYEYMFNDVQTELPETYQWLRDVEEAQGWTIHRIGKDLRSVIGQEGMLPSPTVRFCTRKSKIEPMEAWFDQQDEPVTIYYGLRADEDRQGYVPVEGREVKYPLQEIGIDRDGVYRIVDAQDLRPPSFWWESMYQRVRSKIGGGWQEAFRRWQMEELFAGRTRSNCYFCFYQRQYEYVWLHEQHPTLFRQACWMERGTGGDGYTWRDYPMDRIQKPAFREKVKERRAKNICQHIRQATQHDLFTESGDNPISTTSCGLLCGK